MPELPDLYVYARNLRSRLLNKEITDVKTFAYSRINVESNAYIAACKGSSFADIQQNGKEIVFTLSNGNSFLVHLMLLGKFTIEKDQVGLSLFNKIVSLYFEDNTVLTVSDEQMYAKIELNPQQRTAPDALSDDFSYQYFLNLVLTSSRKNIKSLLLDQQNVRGIGNAYVDEILYNAGISPKSKTGKIPEERIEVLFNQIKQTLQWGIDNILKISPNIISGEIRDFFNVHNKKLKQTKKGEKIIIEKIASKKTYYTASQELYE